MKRTPRNPLSRLDQKELVWFFDLLKDACRERLEKNLISQAMEEQLHERHGVLPGRIDPRPKLKEWEPRYRKFLAVAGEIQDQLQAARFEEITGALAERLAGSPAKQKRPLMNANERK
ncbi:MAG TPA: hypothetical protein VN442_03630 [Bryobacteraceae bacterium]|nr:hypothetical protein [Bryobacteraceae bacterium]